MNAFTEQYPHEKGFAEYYAKHLAPIYEELNKKRVFYLRSFLLALLVAIVVAALMVRLIVVYVDRIDDEIGFLLAVAFAVFVPCFLIYRHGLRELKNTAGDAIACFFGRGISYYADSEFSTSDLCVPMRANHARGGDEITGRHGDVHFRLSEIKLERGSRNVIFKGLFLDLMFQENLFNRTFLYPKHFWRLFSTWDVELIELEDPVYKDKFKIFSDDQVKARLLLSPNFMDRLFTFVILGTSLGEGFIFSGNPLSVEELRQNLSQKSTPFCFFKHDRLQVLLPCEANLFEMGSLFRPFPDMPSLHRTLYQIHMVFELIDAIQPTHLRGLAMDEILG
jgi:hypothetical protein